MEGKDLVELFTPVFDIYEEIMIVRDLIKDDISQFKKTGKFLLFDENGQTAYCKTKVEELMKQKKSESSPLKEVNQNNNNNNNKKGKTTATGRKNSGAAQPLVKIKQEKLDDVDKENNDSATVAMPPPAAKPATRGRKPKVKAEPKETKSTRSTRATIKKELLEVPPEPKRFTEARPSDVILQKEDIPIVDLNSSTDDAEDTPPSPKPKRNSRTSRTSEEKKRSLSASSNEGRSSSTKPPQSKRTKRTNKKPEKEEPPVKEKSDESVYEDARSSVSSNKTAVAAAAAAATAAAPPPSMNQLEQTYICDNPRKDTMMNETVVINKETVNPGNETVVVEKPKIVKKAEKDDFHNMDDLLTDDDSYVEEDRVPTKSQEKPSKKIVKPLFSAYENSPVKKKVEAFEQIANEQANQARVTRSKKKPPTTNERAGVTTMTPLKGSRLPTAITSTSKIPSKATTPLSEKSRSAMKASQQEFRERELRRIEKEKEQARLKQQMAEEARKKREEKHIKAQKKREEEEIKKKKLLAEHLQKEQEKRDQLLAEREEKMRKKQEAEKKKLLAAKEKKQEEERKKLEEEKRKLEEERRRFEEERAERKYPIYMTQAMPLLPTEDCYDSDDTTVKPKEPYWAEKKNLHRMLRLADNSGHKLKNTFFCTKPTTINLADIFENIASHKLKRTSSAIWRQPPRFTLLPRTEESFLESN